MPTNTPKLNLVKPLKTENYNVDVFNENADKIDTYATNTDNAVALKTDKLLTTNLITNGDFSNGTTGWSANNSTISTSANTLINTGNGSSQFPRTNGGSIFANNQTYYVRMRARVTNSDAVEMFIGHGPSAIARITVPIINQWYQVTGVVSNPSNAELRIYHSYADSATANGKVMEVQYVSVINLTQIFGTGNEPTKEQMDALLSAYPNSWFDGTSEIGSILALSRATLGVQAITPTLLNSRTGTLQYMVSKDGYIMFRGTASGGSLNTDIIVLPENLRPTTTRTFPISANNAFGVITINNLGQVRQTVGALTNVFLDGIIFRVGN
jgi:hypothetical protein